MLAIPEVTDAAIAFGDIKHIPKMEDIPKEFKNGDTQWNKLFNQWFYRGINNLKVAPKEGVDIDKALRAVRAIMCSYSPQHEHKSAACAYMFSEWFTDWSMDPPKQA